MARGGKRTQEGPVGAVLLGSQRARLPLPGFCREGGSNFLGEPGGVTHLLSLILPSTPQGGGSCLWETEISFSLQ